MGSYQSDVEQYGRTFIVSVNFHVFPFFYITDPVNSSFSHREEKNEKKKKPLTNSRTRFTVLKCFNYLFCFIQRIRIGNSAVTSTSCPENRNSAQVLFFWGGELFYVRLG